MTKTFEIFPAIGIARVGTSDEFFIGPELDVPLDLKRRDAAGNLLRQAARFRIFECERDDEGKLVNATEVTLADATIEWSVHLVNRKAAAKRFNRQQGQSERRNNATGDDAADQALIIDAKRRTIGNPGDVVALEGEFQGTSVPLGRLEMRPADNGRLCVIGSDGKSKSVPADRPIGNFADNDAWCDSMSDGPVTARVTRGEESAEATPAWVIVAPPDHAPEIANIITMHDTLFDLAVTREEIEEPPVIFFDRHVRPILDRAMSMQWVNKQARLGYDDDQSGGHAQDGPGDFADALDRLGDPTRPNGPRNGIFRLLRDPETLTFPAPVNERKQMPRLHDDEQSGDVLPLTRQQYRALKLWAAGTFQTTNVAEPVEEPLPEALTRVALESCAGGPFFPGIEAGRIMRDATRYMDGEPFRLSHAQLVPGEITARNAVPWQADFLACAWDRGERLGWWPAQRPDDVLTSAAGEPLRWIRGLQGSFLSMVNHWHRLGFVKKIDADLFLEQDRDETLDENGSVT